MKFLYKLVTARKQKSRFFSALLSFLFFIGMVGLYSGLGTFVSSCGPSSTTKTSITIIAPNFPSTFCMPPFYGGTVDFYQAYVNGWGITLSILPPTGGTPFYNYNFVTTTSSNGAYIDSGSPNKIQNVQVPFDANYPYKVRLNMVSPCYCVPNSNTRKTFDFYSGIYNYPSTAGSIGTFPATFTSSHTCN